ncbi:ABC-2 type transport system permease protein [Natronobacillus azotifigens]|uniref:ABC transporter permease n=1 Tax=Natronobacillus azotifigens TaxID=472978 RepID=A0A9J6R7N9_9BACI|nr:ABC transporter permease [Natronobacillus azotifigens]MCZ0701637.1 ABC transporter permease [Natronobacillus azotifigens]
MFRLIQNEWGKIFRKKATFIMIGFLIIAVIGFGGILKYLEPEQEQVEHPTDWQAELQAQIDFDQEQLGMYSNARMDMVYKRNIAINTYRIEQNLPPNPEVHVWAFVEEVKFLLSFAGLFTIIVAAGIVSSEFSSGTIKLLLIRPISRVKILLSKYTTSLLFGLFLIGIIYFVASVIGFILFGSPSSEAVHLAYRNGTVVEQSMPIQLISDYLLNSINLLMVATMAFMISAVFRSNSFALAIALFLYLMGGNITMLVASRFDWAQYILFANTDLTVYTDGVPPVEGMTLAFSIGILLIYFLFFHFLAFGVFQKRDVVA